MPYSVVKTADGTVKASAGTVFAVIASGDGVTSGDTVLIKNDTTTLIEFLFGATDDTYVFCPGVGIEFDTNIKVEICDNGASAVTVVYE